METVLISIYNSSDTSLHAPESLSRAPRLTHIFLWTPSFDIKLKCREQNVGGHRSLNGVTLGYRIEGVSDVRRNHPSRIQNTIILVLLKLAPSISCLLPQTLSSELLSSMRWYVRNLETHACIVVTTNRCEVRGDILSVSENLYAYRTCCDYTSESIINETLSDTFWLGAIIAHQSPVLRSYRRPLPFKIVEKLTSISIHITQVPLTTNS